MKLAKLTIGLLFILGIFSSCNSGLSKDEAKKLLLEKMQLPIAYTKQLSQLRLENSKELKKMFEDSLFVDPSSIQSEQVEEYTGGGFYLPPVSITIGFPWALTDKGKKYFVKDGIDPFSSVTDNTAPIVKLADLEIDEILQISKGGILYINSGKVELTDISFRLKSSNLTPFGKIIINPQKQQAITFIKSVSIYKDKDEWVIHNPITSIAEEP